LNLPWYMVNQTVAHCAC